MRIGRGLSLFTFVVLGPVLLCANEADAKRAYKGKQRVIEPKERQVIQMPLSAPSSSSSGVGGQPNFCEDNEGHEDCVVQFFDSDRPVSDGILCTDPNNPLCCFTDEDGGGFAFTRPDCATQTYPYIGSSGAVITTGLTHTAECSGLGTSEPVSIYYHGMATVTDDGTNYKYGKTTRILQKNEQNKQPSYNENAIYQYSGGDWGPDDCVEKDDQGVIINHRLYRMAMHKARFQAFPSRNTSTYIAVFPFNDRLNGGVNSQPLFTFTPSTVLWTPKVVSSSITRYYQARDPDRVQYVAGGGWAGGFAQVMLSRIVIKAINLKLCGFSRGNIDPYGNCSGNSANGMQKLYGYIAGPAGSEIPELALHPSKCIRDEVKYGNDPNNPSAWTDKDDALVCSLSFEELGTAGARTSRTTVINRVD